MHSYTMAKYLPACNLSLHLLPDVLILLFIVSSASVYIFAGFVVTLDGVVSLTQSTASAIHKLD